MKSEKDDFGYAPPSRLSRWFWWGTLAAICLGIPALTMTAAFFNAYSDFEQFFCQRVNPELERPLFYIENRACNLKLGPLWIWFLRPMLIVSAPVLLVLLFRAMLRAVRWLNQRV